MGHSETVRPCNRCRLGSVIILSSVAQLAWEAMSELVRKDREGRVMTVDLALEGQRTLWLGSAYFPTTGAFSNERQASYDEMARCSASSEPVLPVINDRLLAAVLAGTRLCRRHEDPFYNLSTTCPDGVRTGRRNRL